MSDAIDDEMIRYDLLVERALRNLVREVLVDVSEKGLPGDHHFFITFRTHAIGSIVPERLLAQYPQQMTIVIQHQFSQLRIFPDRFSIRLTFGGIPGEVVVPFGSITTFHDPHANFTLKFTQAANGDADDMQEANSDDAAGEEPAASEAAPIPEGSQAGGSVISLDKFRKK